MKKVKSFFLLLFSLFVIIFQSCIKEYDYSQQSTLKPESNYFDFTTKRTITLNVDYGFTGHTALLEVYTQSTANDQTLIKEEVISNKTVKNPQEAANLIIKLNKEPIYKAYTNNNCSFSGQIEIPSYVEKIYVCSTSLGIPRCVELSIANNVATYSYNAVTRSATPIQSKTMTAINIGSNYRTIDSGLKLYGLYDTYEPAYGEYNWKASNSKLPSLYSLVEPGARLTQLSTLGELMDRIDNALGKNDNSRFISPEKNLNISIKQPLSSSNIDGARLELVLLNDHGDMHSSIAYYYYKSDQTPTAEQIKALPKYLILPRLTSSAPRKIIKTRLQFFGENGKQAGTDLFPKGYTIGFVLITDLFPYDKNQTFWSDISLIEDRMSWAYGSAGQYVYTNQSANYKQQAGCISIYDEKAQKIILGFEDQTFRDENDKSFDDIIFYVDADPIESIIDNNRPSIPIPPDEITYTTETTRGTLAFEDIWPSGGDYDMNDVVVEYESTITFNNRNKITKIVDTFTPIHDGANFTNAFGYVINDNLGTINTSQSNFYSLEEANQIILFPNAREAVANKQKFTVTREFPEGIDKIQYKRNYNPFIAVNYKQGEKNRVEVHLPKSKPTSWANTSLIGTMDDAYFVNKEGNYPFAIDLPIINFKPVTEGARIGKANEYPNFTKWANSFGKESVDWYLNKE